MSFKNNRIPLLALSFMLACTQDRALDEITMTEITAQGGVARSFDGLAEVHFPAGAVGSMVEITIRTVSTDDPVLVSKIYEVGPASLGLLSAVEVRISTVHSGARLARITESGSVTIENQSAPDSDWVWAKVNKLAAYACASVPVDAGIVDAGPRDLGRPDLGPERPDLGRPDLGRPDLGRPDLDAGTEQDMGFVDAGDMGPPLDAGDPDVGVTPDGGVLMPVPVCGLNAVTEQEPNNSLATATPGSLGAKTPWEGTLTTGDVDWYALSIGGTPASLRLTTSTVLGDPAACIGADTLLVLTDSAGVELARNDDAGGGTCSQLNIAAPAAGTYYVRVEGTAQSAYFLSAIAQPVSGSGGPDLKTSALTPQPTPWVSSTNALVSICLENIGDANADLNEFNLYLSPTMTFDQNAVLLTIQPAQAIAAGGVVQLDIALTSPQVMAPSTAYLIGLIDPNNVVLEIQESNNITSPVAIQLVP